MPWQHILVAMALAPNACPCPDTVSSPAHAISAVLISNPGRPRTWLELEIGLQAHIPIELRRRRIAHSSLALPTKVNAV
jgi:hypothetical protein